MSHERCTCAASSNNWLNCSALELLWSVELSIHWFHIILICGSLIDCSGKCYWLPELIRAGVAVAGKPSSMGVEEGYEQRHHIVDTNLQRYLMSKEHISIVVDWLNCSVWRAVMVCPVVHPRGVGDWPPPFLELKKQHNCWYNAVSNSLLFLLFTI